LPLFSAAALEDWISVKNAKMISAQRDNDLVGIVSTPAT
jgi:hypothetical protein